MKYYTFRQNNSGGSFVTNEEVAHFVIIEAPDARLANSIAQEFGIYFDGCSSYQDCSCCGDRWYRADESDGYETPLLYGSPIEEYKPWWDEKCIIHYLDRRKEVFELPAKTPTYS